MYKFCLLILLILPAAYGLACSGTWECTPAISTDYNFAECINGQCACRTSLGFDGNATASSKCRCDSPKSVYWNSGSPYCLSYQSAVDSENDIENVEILKSKVIRIYENLIFPTPALIMTDQISIDDLFSATARGRVDPLGTFDTKALLKEYFYGLAITPTTQAVAVNVKDIFGVGRHVFFRGDVTFRVFTDPSATVILRDYNLTQSGRYIFDENNLVQSAELIIHNMGKANNPTADEIPFVIPATCSILLQTPGNCQNHAFDPEGFYSSFEECLEFLGNIPFGTFDQAFSNSVSCRAIHTILTIYDPAEHCQHAGKTGGGKCVDVPYSDYYLQDY